MEVNIKFDTEKEELGNLKKLVEALQQLIDHREGKETVEVNKPAKEKTSGGCRVIPYEDMSEKMTQLLSGRRF